MGDLYLFGKDFHEKWFTSRPLTEEEKRKRQLKREKQEDSALLLHNAERLFNQLMANPKLVVIDAEDAARIFKLFRGRDVAPSSLLFSHRAFLQAAMMAAIDGSFAMGFVEAMFKSVYMKPVVDAKSLGKVLRKLGSQTLKHLYKHGRGKDIMEAEVYKSTLAMISYQCGPYFQAIEQGIDI